MLLEGDPPNSPATEITPALEVVVGLKRLNCFLKTSEGVAAALDNPARSGISACIGSASGGCKESGEGCDDDAFTAVSEETPSSSQRERKFMFCWPPYKQKERYQQVSLLTRQTNVFHPCSTKLESWHNTLNGTSHNRNN